MQIAKLTREILHKSETVDGKIGNGVTSAVQYPIEGRERWEDGSLQVNVGGQSEAIGSINRTTQKIGEREEILGGGENGEQRDDMTIPTILDENISQLASLLKTFRDSEK